MSYKPQSLYSNVPTLGLVEIRQPDSVVVLAAARRLGHSLYLIIHSRLKMEDKKENFISL